MRMSVTEQQSQSATHIDGQHPLSVQQKQLVQKILQQCRHLPSDHTEVIVIEGHAGCGKSVVLNALFHQIQTEARNRDLHSPLYGTKNTLLVNHPEMLKLYKEASRPYQDLRIADYERPTTFINQHHKTQQSADILLIDEAHLLLTKADRYNHFLQNNHLEELLKLAKLLIIVYDPMQVLKCKSLWDQTKLEQLLAQVKTTVYQVKAQFRMQANADVLAWVNGVVQKKIMPLPAKQPYDFRLFENAKSMYQTLCEKNTRYGMSRILATYDYPYTLNGKDYFVTEGDFSLRWDRSKPNERLAWSERPDTIEEVGSVYTIQGFDLNYAAVIIGPTFTYDAQHDCIAVNPALYQDQAAFNGSKDLKDAANVKENLMLNALNVLLTRGVKGLYVYISDPLFRRRVMQ